MYLERSLPRLTPKRPTLNPKLGGWEEAALKDKLGVCPQRG
jgi:hypothetical protein